MRALTHKTMSMSSKIHFFACFAIILNLLQKSVSDWTTSSSLPRPKEHDKTRRRKRMKVEIFNENIHGKGEEVTTKERQWWHKQNRKALLLLHHFIVIVCVAVGIENSTKNQFKRTLLTATKTSQMNSLTCFGSRNIFHFNFHIKSTISLFHMLLFTKAKVSFLLLVFLSLFLFLVCGNRKIKIIIKKR